VHGQEVKKREKWSAMRDCDCQVPRREIRGESVIVGRYRDNKRCTTWFAALYSVTDVEQYKKRVEDPSIVTTLKLRCKNQSLKS
jgi:hypothetical protein